ncbi:MAG: hypothetical protein JNN15_18350, partial [Blastocatellia bacterium]|nr:hypothetical protein [Blastocatellia bacterium]
MIKLQDSLNNSLKLLKNFLTNVRYDWVYQRLTDLGYFYDPTTFPTDKTVTNQLFHLAIQSNTFALFRNGQKLFKDAAAELLNLPLQQDLADLGLLKLSQDGVQTNGYHIGVWLGFYFIQSSAEITASVKVEDYRIAQEIMKFSGNSLLCLGSDVAFTAITNSANWKNIDTVAKNSEAFQIATANTILNDLESKVRVIEYEEIDQSRNYDLIATTETSLLLPVEYQHYYPGPSVSENFEAI